MSTIRVNDIVNEPGTGAPNFSKGITVNGTTTSTAQFTGSISGTTLNVTAVSTGTISVGDVVYGVGVSPITKIMTKAASGLTGTYEVSVFQNAGSGTMYASSGTVSKIRISDTDTSSVTGQPLGTIEFFSADTPGAFVGQPPPGPGVGAYISAISESISHPDAALVFGTRENVNGGGRDANERLRIGGNGVISFTGNAVPSATNSYDLGSTALRWRNIYTQDLHLSNGIGDYTVVEGVEDLFLVNNKTGKSFKFALIEVDPKEVPPKSDV